MSCPSPLLSPLAIVARCWALQSLSVLQPCWLMGVSVRSCLLTICAISASESWTSFPLALLRAPASVASSRTLHWICCLCSLFRHSSAKNNRSSLVSGVSHWANPWTMVVRVLGVQLASSAGDSDAMASATVCRILLISCVTGGLHSLEKALVSPARSGWDTLLMPPDSTQVRAASMASCASFRNRFRGQSRCSNRCLIWCS